MRLKKYLTEMPSSDRGKTVKDKTGHQHDFSVKRTTGDGSTSKDAGHSHKIRKFIVQEATGHTHKLGKVYESKWDDYQTEDHVIRKLGKDSGLVWKIYHKIDGELDGEYGTFEAAKQALDEI